MACKGALTPQEKYPFKTGTCHILKYFKPPALKSFNPPPHLDRFNPPSTGGKKYETTNLIQNNS